MGEEDHTALYARVMVDRSLDREFDYSIPEGLRGQVAIGSRVRVPFRNQTISGTVVSLPREPVSDKLRAVESVLPGGPVVDASMLGLARWMADYYCSPMETVIRALLPEVIRKGETGARTRLRARGVWSGSEEEFEQLRRKAPVQAAVLEFLHSRGGEVDASEIQETCGAGYSTLRAMAAKNRIELNQRESPRDPHARDTFVQSTPLTLNQEQLEALRLVCQSIDVSADSKPLLLHGVTGSGKTEVYLQAIQHALDQDRGAIVLVPEISLTPQTVERFKGRFAALAGKVAVLHSHLSSGERHDEWKKVRSGEARIVIGARSALFAPVRNLGLIVVDEEHETSYKQEEAPRYQARDVAVVRGRMEPCAVLLGSATPSLESYRNAKIGKYLLMELKERVDHRQLPLIRILDMRLEGRKRKEPSIVADRLRQKIDDRLEKGEQTILFLNRRGFATSLICPECGHVCQCPNCSLALTFHRAEGSLVCHLCGHAEVAPHSCPSCRTGGIRHRGTGTEKVEQAVSRLFPKARVARMDADAMTRKDAYRETLGAFKAGKVDILIGTQMIAKGLHFPNVTLVGILNADLGLHIPDFRAGERTFQLLTQVAGRAGRGDMEGEVFVQTCTPHSPSIQFARHHDYAGFWEQESEYRRATHFPPFGHMVLMTVRSEHERLAQFTAETLHRRLREKIDDSVDLGDPAPAPIAKAKGFFRFHVSLRTRAILPLSRRIKEILREQTLPAEVHVAVDVDPFQLL